MIIVFTDDAIENIVYWISFYCALYFVFEFLRQHMLILVFLKDSGFPFYASVAMAGLFTAKTRLKDWLFKVYQSSLALSSKFFIKNFKNTFFFILSNPTICCCRFQTSQLSYWRMSLLSYYEQRTQKAGWIYISAWRLISIKKEMQGIYFQVFKLDIVCNNIVIF